jgi:hypothetical protein
VEFSGEEIAIGLQHFLVGIKFGKLILLGHVDGFSSEPISLSKMRRKCLDAAGKPGESRHSSSNGRLLFSVETNCLP